MNYLKYRKKKKEEKELDSIYTNYNERLESCNYEIDMVYKKFKKKSEYKTKKIAIYKELKKLYLAEEKSANFAGVKYLPMNLMISIASSMITVSFFSFSDKNSLLTYSMNLLKSIDRNSDYFILIYILSAVILFGSLFIALSISLSPVFVVIRLTDNKARERIKKVNLILHLLEERIEDIEKARNPLPSIK